MAGVSGLSAIRTTPFGGLVSENVNLVTRILAAGPVAYWPLDETAGGTANDNTATGADGTNYNLTIGEPGVGDGGTSYLFENNVASCVYFDAGPLAALNGVFNGAEGSLIAWIRLPVEFWTDGDGHVMFHFYADVDNNIRLYKQGAVDGRLMFVYRAGGVDSTIQLDGNSQVGWLRVGMTWSATADEFRAYFGSGEVAGSPATGLGVWAGALDGLLTVLGANARVAGNGCGSWEAHIALWDAPQTEATIISLLNL